MSFALEIRKILAADATLLAQATGSIYVYEQMGRLGLNRTTLKKLLKEAFDDDGLLKPCVIIKLRDEIRVPQILDSALQLASTRQVAEIYCYDDGSAGYTKTAILRERIYTLLQETRIDGRVVSWVRDRFDQRDYDLDGACWELSEYECYRVKGL